MKGIRLILQTRCAAMVLHRPPLPCVFRLVVDAIEQQYSGLKSRGRLELTVARIDLLSGNVWVQGHEVVTQFHCWLRQQRPGHRCNPSEPVEMRTSPTSTRTRRPTAVAMVPASQEGGNRAEYFARSPMPSSPWTMTRSLGLVPGRKWRQTSCGRFRRWSG